MPVQKPSKVASFALKTLTAAVLGSAVLAPLSVNAAGLGKLTVLSSLGQPLRAEIELTAVSAEEASELVAKLASPDAFRAANIEFNPALLSLRFEVEARGSRQFIRITSSQAINEPFVDMLLELTWTNGRLVREYTFLLDPADLRTAQSPQVAAPVSRNTRPAAPVAAPAAPAAAPSAAPSAPAEAPARARAPAATQDQPRAAASQDAPSADSYAVRKGDTLGKIAGRLKPADVSLDMMLVALYRANPDAFAGSNMNRLKSGTILSVPDANTVKGTSQGEAHGVVVAHAADFNAYRNKLAGQVAAATPAKEPEAQQSQTGKITAQVKERPTAVTESKDQLKLSKAGDAASKAGKTGAVEDKIAKDRQMADASARVKELEKNVNDLEKLMEVKNKAAASAQAKASAAAAAPAASPAASAPAKAAPAATAPAAPAPAPAPAVQAPAASAPAAPAPAASAPAEEPAKPAKPKRSVAAPAPAPAPVGPSLVDTIMENITLIGAAVAALLGGAALVIMRRRKAAAEDMSLASVETTGTLGDPGTTAHSLFAETGGQSVDTSNSVFNSNFAPSASQLDTNEVDPVAEADVYIAYGRDAQAEEILKEALRVHPERHPVRLKLLEIYAGRKDARAFETQASELYSMTKGVGDEWAQAAALGSGIDPDNPLYVSAAQAKAAAGLGGAAAAGAAAAPFVASQSNELNDFAAMFAEPAPAAPAMAPADAGGLDLDLSQEASPVAAEANLMDFDLDRDANALPSLAEEAKPAAKADDSSTLDFDLGGLSFDEPAPAAAAAPAPAAVPAAEEAHDLSFDLGLDTPPAKVEAVEAAPVPDAMADIGMDFNLDLPGAGTAEAPAAAPAANPLAELDSMDFSLPGGAAPAAVPAAEEAPLSAADFALDLPGMDAPAPAAAPAAAPADFDLSSINLDLGGVAAPAAPKGEEEMSALHMEMDTKLDLAVAYQEIGDKEGARELLDEVIRGGSDDQVARANSMRALLG